jgi:RNA polymerase sigma-70 factor (ECF subfamily)
VAALNVTGEGRALTQQNRSLAAQPGADRTAFAEIVNAHWSAVYRTLHCLTGNTHDTEDLTQETFLRALSRMDSFRPGTSLRNWLLRIATNAFFDLRRRRQRAKVQPLAEEPLADAPLPEHSLEAAEQSELARMALAELSETTRLVFHLRVQEELSFREIAAMIGSTEEAARWHASNARKRLLKRLADRPDSS